jgi:hypothetical protein
MKKRYHTLLLLALCSAGLTACYTPRYMYSPNNVNVPILAAKGDGKLAANYAFSLAGSNNDADPGPAKFFNKGFDLQGAYAFTNHWGVIVNHSGRSERNSGRFENIIDSATINYKRRLTEIGIGYFGRLKNNRSMVQLFAGYGTGRFTMDDGGKDRNNIPYTRYHRATVRKIFLQPAVQADISPYFTSSFASRFNFVFFSGIETDYTADEQESYLLKNLEGRTAVFWEPAFVNNVGFKKLPGLRLELQVGFASLVSTKFIDYRTVNMSIGAMADLRGLFGKKRAASGKDK